MFKRFVLIGISLCLLIVTMTPALAQNDGTTSSEDAMIRSYNSIDELILEQTDTGLLLTIRSTMPDGCDLPLQFDTFREGTIWYIDVYRDMPLTLMCPMMLQTDESNLDASILNELDEGALLIDLIVINDRVFHIDRAQIEDVGDAAVPPPLITPWFTSPVNVIDMQTQLVDAALALEVQWLPFNGCEGVTVSRLRLDPFSQPARYEVLLYLAVPSDPVLTDCPPAPQFLAPFVETFTPNHDPLQRSTFAGDTLLLRYTPQFTDAVPQANEWTRELASITSTDQIQTLVMESFPPQLSVQVAWQEGGPCPASYREVVQGVSGNNVSIVINHVIAADSACGRALLPVELNIPLGSFDESPVTIDVNGVQVDVGF